MSVWTSADKLVKKEIMQAGDFSDKPTELSVCTIDIENIQLMELSIDQIKQDLHSNIVDQDTQKVIIIGEACSTIDRYIERAIQMMSINEQSVITVQFPTDDTGSKTDILSLEITLVAVKFHKPIWEWTSEEKYENALRNKEKGVELFKAKRYVDAFHKFSKACKMLITLEPIDLEENPEMKKIYDLKQILYNNIAECQLIRENNEHVITLCNKVLSKEENNVKALYRRGVARGNLRDYERASEDLKIVVALEPKNKRAQEKYNIYSERWRASVQGYENMVRKMFKV